jgi:K+-sensing histidine kinase KdpD
LEQNKNQQLALEKILVCITPQSNSRRLINHGHHTAFKVSGELHILHVEKGNNIFMHSDSSEILQELFDYGSELGGVIHAVCGEDIPEAIYEFVKEQEITRIVLGEPPEDMPQTSNSVIEQLELMVPYLKIEILKRTQSADTI